MGLRLTHRGTGQQALLATKGLPVAGIGKKLDQAITEAAAQFKCSPEDLVVFLQMNAAKPSAQAGLVFKAANKKK